MRWLFKDALQALGIEMRAGLHTGEREVRGDDIGGIVVHIGARVSAIARPNEGLVSSTLRDLVIGSGLEFGDGWLAGPEGGGRFTQVRKQMLDTDLVKDQGALRFTLQRSLFRTV